MLCPKCQSKQGLLRCDDCFSRCMLCHDCCLMVHQDTPFHSIKKWTGHFFQDTSLNEDRFTLHLCHGGAPCPEAQFKTGTQDNKKCLVVVDVSGVHQLHIGWCQCDDAPGADIQLLRNHLFPASISNPSTAFTFKLLNYFHIDSVECKTSALSFFSKLRCLTNDSSPDSVPVGLPVFYPLWHQPDCTYRIGIEN